jgi:hypothetical protein
MGLMRWPWVSRERLEDAQREISELKQERRELLDRLLAEPEKVATTSTIREIDDGLRPVTAHKEENNILPFSTPFDRMEGRLAGALKSGPVPEKFKAKIR